MNIEMLQQRLRLFAEERAWGEFHNPKNLVMALSAEAGELVQLFQWLTPEQSAEASKEGQLRRRMAEEMADVLAYLLRLADVLDLDLEEALEAKMAVNAANYPVHLSKGNARKYNDLRQSR